MPRIENKKHMCPCGGKYLDSHRAIHSRTARHRKYEAQRAAMSLNATIQSPPEVSSLEELEERPDGPEADLNEFLIISMLFLLPSYNL
jgi:hypothetical protein